MVHLVLQSTYEFTSNFFLECSPTLHLSTPSLETSFTKFFTNPELITALSGDNGHSSSEESQGTAHAGTALGGSCHGVLDQVPAVSTPCQGLPRAAANPAWAAQVSPAHTAHETLCQNTCSQNSSSHLQQLTPTVTALTTTAQAFSVGQNLPSHLIHMG